MDGSPPPSPVSEPHPDSLSLHKHRQLISLRLVLLRSQHQFVMGISAGLFLYLHIARRVLQIFLRIEHYRCAMLWQRAEICRVHHPAFRLGIVFSGILWPLRFFRQTLEFHQALHPDNHFLGRLILLQKLVADLQAVSLQHRIYQRQHLVIMHFLTCRAEEFAQAITNMTVFGSAAFLELLRRLDKARHTFRGHFRYGRWRPISEWTMPASPLNDFRISTGREYTLHFRLPPN